MMPAGVPVRLREAGGQFLRFGVVGAVGFCVDAGVLLGEVAMGVDPVTARLLSFACAVMATFELNRRWAFQGDAPRPYLATLLSYLGVQGIGFLCNLAAYTALLLLLPPPLGRPLPCLAAASALALTVNFAGARFVVFRRRPA